MACTFGLAVVAVAIVAVRAEAYERYKFQEHRKGKFDISFRLERVDYSGQPCATCRLEFAVSVLYPFHWNIPDFVSGPLPVKSTYDWREFYPIERGVITGFSTDGAFSAIMKIKTSGNAPCMQDGYATINMQLPNVIHTFVMFRGLVVTIRWR
jgi:hypothetical protein